MPSPCDGCDAPCCRLYRIYVTGYDAYRICTTLQLPMADFLDLDTADAVDDQHFRIVLRGDRPPEARAGHRLQLLKVDDPDPRYPHRCVFLLSVGTRGRCGVYSVRPDVCAIYPTSYDDGLVGTGGGGQYCPPDSWHVEGIDVPLFRVWHHHRDRQQVIYDALIDGWNAQVVATRADAHPGRYYQFLYNAYGALERRDSSLFAADPVDGRGSAEIAALVAGTLREIGWPG